MDTEDLDLKSIKLKKVKQPSLSQIEKTAKEVVGYKEKAKASHKELKAVEQAKQLAGDIVNIIDSDMAAKFSEQLAPILKNKDTAFEPDAGLFEMSPERCPGPQTRFLASDEYEVLFAGGRGSGKSLALIVDPLRFCHKRKFKALIIRKTMPELRELIGRAKEIYPLAFKGARWKEQEKLFEFPSGAKIEFGYCDAIDDAERYRGQEYTWLGIDEISQYSTDEILEKLSRSIRTTDPELQCFIRATTNPSGAGVLWVKKRWIDRAKSDVPVIDTYATALGDISVSRKWIHSTVLDNPTLLKANPQYLATLASLQNKTLRKQWLEGSWDDIEGLAFNEFKESVHTCEPFPIPKHWRKFRAADWGYNPGLAVCLWFAKDPDTGCLYVYRELAANGKHCETNLRLTADKFAWRVMDLEKAETIQFGVLDGSVWAERGQVGDSVGDTMLNLGCMWIPADRSKGSRYSGKQLIHSYLSVDINVGEPRVKIFTTCPQLIKEMQHLTLDPNDKEDVDTTLEDHAYDAFRYGILTQPTIYDGPEPFNSSYEQKPILVNTKFGW